MKTRFNYKQSKQRIFAADQAQGLDDVIVIGRDPNGQPVGWSTLDEQATRALLDQHGFTPEAVD